MDVQSIGKTGWWFLRRRLIVFRYGLWWGIPAGIVYC